MHRVLLIEDNPGDARLIREMLAEEPEAPFALHCAERLQHGLEQLSAGETVLVLLDLNLPKKDGREVLQEIKNDERLKRIPVVILTTSKAEEDVLKTYNLHANCYVTKPVDLEKFSVVIKSIDAFWLTVATLPNGQ